MSADFETFAAVRTTPYIAGSIRKTATLLEVLVAIKGPEVIWGTGVQRHQPKTASASRRSSRFS